MKQRPQGGLIIFKSPVLSGHSYSRWLGPENSAYSIVGVDIHSNPGMVQASPALKNISMVDELCKVMVSCTNDNIYYFSSTSGKIWMRKYSDSTYYLVYTTSPAAGGAECRGAFEYNGHIYWLTQYRLHRITRAGAADTTWTTGIDLNWQTCIPPGNAHFAEVNGVMYFTSNGQTISEVNEAGTYTASRLSVPGIYHIQALCGYGTDLVVGINRAFSVHPARVLVWNTYSKSYSFSDDLQETAITSIVVFDNRCLIFPEKTGRVYYLNGMRADLFFNLPTDRVYSSLVIPQHAVHVDRNFLYMGVYDHFQQRSGIYVFGAARNGFPDIVSMKHIATPRMSTGDTQAPKLNSWIYALRVTDRTNTIFVHAAIGDRTVTAGVSSFVYSVNELDTTNTEQYTYIDSKNIIPDNYNLTRISYGFVDYGRLTTDHDIELLLYINNDTWVEGVPTIDTVRKRITYNFGNVEAKYFNVRLLFRRTAAATVTEPSTVYQWGIKLE